jgi:DNA-binding NarL/FixJ family response regulator
MRILIVDDERLTLDFMHRSLRHHRPAWEVFTAANGAEAMVLLRSMRFDLLVTDIQMPTLDGLGLLASVRGDAILRHLPLIFITSRDDRASIRLGMGSGADDYLTKPFSCDELIQAIETRIQRGAAAPAQDPEARRLREDLQRQLTTRQLDILKRVAAGRVTKEIAADLGLSPQTISVHRANIMRKLDLHNAAALAALAMRAGLDESPGWD